MFVSVAVNIPTDRTFVYRVPSDLEPAVALGKRALVPFGGRTLTAFILEVLSASDFPKTKDLIRVLDAEPLFSPADLLFYQWLATYYMQSLGKVLGEALPSGITPRTERMIRLTADGDTAVPADLSEEEALLMNCLRDNPGGITGEEAGRLLPAGTLKKILPALQKRYGVIVEERVKQAGITTRKEKWLTPLRPAPEGVKLTARQRGLLQFIESRGDIALTKLRGQEVYSPALLKTLREKGVVAVTEKELFRGNGILLPAECRTEPPVLNREQAKANRKIREKLSLAHFSVCLLHGVTGSGKTEVYLHAMEEALLAGGSVLYLVPEISLTTQLVDRVQGRFPDREIAVWHSDIPETVRYDQWKRIYRGEVRIVVGARSAVFAPLQHLKLIVVDEEHDGSYKQDERTRYNGRDAAIVKGKLGNATVVLGSATPGLATYHYAQTGKYSYLSLPGRVVNRPLPEVEVVSMAEEKDDTGAVPILSRTLISAMADSLAGGYQTLLFLNRRGFNTFLYCPDCRHVFSCPNCTVSLTYHGDTGRLHCHYCDYSEKIATSCPACGKNRVIRYGAGTERLEEEVRGHFPKAVIGRMDRDTVSGRGSREGILRRLEKREIDILVGTQMITKGHDFPHINLIGVICADLSLNIPDFRAAERTFQILTQVAGRSGRGDVSGRVIIQALNPDHYAIARARYHDYTSFFADEIALRKTYAYPPFSRMITLHLSAVNKVPAEQDIAALKAELDAIRKKELSFQRIDVMGPTRSPIEKIRGRHRWQILLRGKEIGALHELARAILNLKKAASLRITADVDPLNFM
jgi:primosomal protein N' (replication factor Y) (superfamily II helicase)